MATVFFRMSRSMRSRSFSRRSREISAAGSGTECGADAGVLGRNAGPAFPPSAPITPVAKHRGCDAQLPCGLRQRPTAARQQGNRLPLELIRKLTTALAHRTPFRSPRSLPKMSTNSGEADLGEHRFERTPSVQRHVDKLDTLRHGGNLSKRCVYPLMRTGLCESKANQTEVFCNLVSGCRCGWPDRSASRRKSL